MSQPGIGAMMHYLSGGSTESPSKYAGRTIAEVAHADDALRLVFDDGVKIVVSDNGQSCCEHRYMDTDDDVQSLVGQKLVGIEAKDAPDQADEYGDVHEVVFLEVRGDKSFVTFSFHNQHNGYYGGFGLNIAEE